MEKKHKPWKGSTWSGCRGNLFRDFLLDKTIENMIDLEEQMNEMPVGVFDDLDETLSPDED